MILLPDWIEKRIKYRINTPASNSIDAYDMHLVIESVRISDDVYLTRFAGDTGKYVLCADF